MPDSLDIASVPMQADTLRPHKVVQHLTFEEPDSVLGSYFVDCPSPSASHMLRIDLPDGHLPLPTDSVFLASFRQLWPEPIRKMAWEREEIPWQPNGIAGDPADYTFRNDDNVTGIMLASFFVMAWVVASSWKFLRTHFKEFFYTRERGNLFAERDGRQLRGRAFLVVQTCFLISLLSFTATRTLLPDVFSTASPYLLLGGVTVVSVLYYLLKLLLYGLVNHTFFSPIKCHLWTDTYLVSVLLTGCVLLPVVLLVVFFDLPFAYAVLVTVLLLSVIKTMLLYKSYCIFFKTSLGIVHVILYLCTLEIIPFSAFLATLYALISGMPAL